MSASQMTSSPPSGKYSGAASPVSASPSKPHPYARASKRPTISAKDAESLRKGLAQLVLQLLNLLRQLMEKQAIRRMPSLPPEKQEELGTHLMLLREKMEEMKEYFGIEDDEMELGLLEELDDLATNMLRSCVDDQLE